MPLHKSYLAWPNLPALALAAALLIVGSLVRAAAQPLLGVAPILAACLTCLVFVIPAFVAGAIAPRAALLDGGILGMIGAVFVTLQVAQFHQPNWSSPLVYETIGLLACLAVPLCLLGAVLGGKLFRAR
jgi:hypothetical protein